MLESINISNSGDGITFKSFKNAGFTLAEVLITLGIIGVVAAMTIPNLTHKIKSKVLATQFKKSIAEITQVIGRIKAENDIDLLADYCTCYSGGEYINRTQCMQWFDNAFTSRSHKKDSYMGGYDVTRSNNEIKTYNGKQFVALHSLEGIGFPLFHTKSMLGGQYIKIEINESNLYVGVDFNGAGKPNRLGHDIFVFIINKKNDFVTYSSVPSEISEEDLPESEKEWVKERAGYPCSINSNQKANGIGCVYYALKNKCPDGSARNYFDCLPK